MKSLYGFFKGITAEVLNSTVRLIDERHGELGYPVSLSYQMRAVGAKRSSEQA